MKTVRKSTAMALAATMVIGSIGMPATSASAGDYYYRGHGGPHYGYSHYPPPRHHYYQPHHHYGYYDYHHERRRKRKNDVAKAVAIGVGLAILGAAIAHGRRR